MTAYYNEFDPYAAQWLRNLIDAGHIAPGDVDTRSIVDVRPDDLAGYTQCHFFAGIGGWSLAARLAGWPDDRPLWTGSCPCQPFSVAGKGGAQEDERHLWPVFFGLIRACRPDVVMGEQVAAAVGKDWLDGVSADLEGIGYACGAAVVPACAVDAPHRRDRLWFVADAYAFKRGPVDSLRGRDPREHALFQGQETSSGSGADSSGDGESGALADASHSGRREERADTGRIGAGDRAEGRPAGRDAGGACGAVSDARGGLLRYGRCSKTAGSSSEVCGEIREQRLRPDAGPVRNARSFWTGAEWAVGADGKARRVEPGIRLLAHGVPARVGKLRACGNAIVPQVAAEVIGAYLECRA